MQNIYLEKIAGLRSFGKKLAQEIREAKALDKVSFGMGAVGLGASGIRTNLASIDKDKEHQRMTLEERSLQTLEDMRKSLEKRHRVTITLKQPGVGGK